MQQTALFLRDSYHNMWTFLCHWYEVAEED
jgi:hypothetical protein